MKRLNREEFTVTKTIRPPWLIADKLTLNASKTEVMLIGSRQRLSTFHNPLSLIVDGAPISQVSSTKSLGVHIDQNLSWNVHVDKLCKKIASGVGALKRVRSFVPYESSIGDGGSGAFLRNCAQTEPSPILLFHRLVCRLVCRLVQSRAGE